MDKRLAHDLCANGEETLKGDRYRQVHVGVLAQRRILIRLDIFVTLPVLFLGRAQPRLDSSPVDGTR